VIAQGTPKEVKKLKTITAAFLNGKEQIGVPRSRRKGSGKGLKLCNCSGHNLKNIDV